MDKNMKRGVSTDEKKVPQSLHVWRKLKAGQDLVIEIMFQVGPGDDYTLTVGGFNDALSTLGDSMTSVQNVNGMKFSTR